MTKKLHQLELIRLEHDWSYRDLSNAIHAATQFRRNQDCWRRICRGQTTTPNDTTRLAITRFLAALPEIDNEASNGRKRRAS